MAFDTRDGIEKSKNVNCYWFEAQGDEELYNSVFSTVKDITKRQVYRSEQNLRYLRLYNNNAHKGVFISDFSAKSKMQMLSLNVVQSLCDTVTNNIGKNKPKVTFLTNSGDYFLQERAKKLDMFTMGQFSMTDVYKKSPITLKRGCVFGDGFVKPYRDNGEICLDKVNPEEIKVDDREGDNPRSFYQVKLVSKKWMSQLYSSKAEKIEKISQESFKDLFFGGFDMFENELIPVIEAWRLPSRKGANDGRHCIVLDNCVLLDEKYTKLYNPFVKLPFSEGIIGWWGVGIAELLTGLQYEINKTLKRIQQSIHLMAVPRVFYEYGSEIVEEHWNNDVGSMVGYQGNPPVVITPQTVGQEVFAHLDYLYQKSFEIIGASQMSAGGAKLPGLDSGEAIRTFRDVETARFAVLQEMYDEFHLEIARRYVDLAKDIAKEDPSFSVITKDSSEGVVRIKWNEVNLDEDEYLLQLYPTNLLPTEPAGKLSTVVEMTKSGFFSKEEAISLLDYPDIKPILNIKKAKQDDITKTIFTMVKKGVYLPPEPDQDLALGIEYCQAHYLDLRLKKVPVERLNLLQQWKSDAYDILFGQNDQIQEGPENQALTEGNIPPDEVPNLDERLMTDLPEDRLPEVQDPTLNQSPIIE